MSFVTAIRDYIELLNNLYDSFSNDLNFQKIIQETIIYLLSSFKFIIVYIISFQWFRDLSYLPILIPQISTSILKETFFLDTPFFGFFNFLEIPSYSSNKFFIGFLNSFFLSLPFSCAHIIFIRRFLIQGTIAGIAAGLGNIFGQIFFLLFTIFGIRSLLIPWFSFEPLNYIIGFSLLFFIIYDMVHERAIKIVQFADQKTLFKIFLLNFALIWTEQSTIFQYLGNLTISPEPTVLESFFANTRFEFFIGHLFYLIGILFGSIIFYTIIALVSKNITDFIQTQFNILRSSWIIKLNFTLLTVILSFTFVSVPFYGFDYLVTGPLGFVSQDRTFKNTFLSPNEAVDPYKVLSAFSFDTDINPFDRGSYLKFPLFQNFEDLNYAGEYALTSRQGSVSLFGQYKEKAKKVGEGINLAKEDKKQPVFIETDKKFNETDNETKNSTNIFEKMEYPTFSNTVKDIYVSSNLNKRFENEYKEFKNTTFSNIITLSLSDAFLYDTSDNLAFSPELVKKLKQKYYSNPIYKFLLSVDIDNFMSRQPKDYSLSGKDEKELYKKRLILGYYHDSLRLYNKLPYAEEFQSLFNGSKSFADRVYNQQFKGTLSVVRRLFSITTNPDTNKQGELVLKYDQPLFSNPSNTNVFLHEELETANQKKSSFVELTNTIPLYVGWDESTRKLVVTNRLLCRSTTGFKNFEKTREKIPEIDFTSWPLSKTMIENSDKKSLIPYRFLFVTKNNVKNPEYERLLSAFEYQDAEFDTSSYQSLPENAIRLVSAIRDILPPNRGGFIWPGNFPLKINFSDFFIK